MPDASAKKEYKNGSGPRHYYKSGWCTKHGHGHFKGKVGPLTSLKSHKRWLELRHYVIYYYKDEQSGYNSWGWPEDEEEQLDDKMKDFSLLDKIPGLPDIKFPSLPNLPKLPDMPDMPDMPSLHMPSLSMPSLSMPSLSMPSLSMPSLDLKNMKMPAMPKKKERIEGAPLGRVQMSGCKVKQSGKKLKLTNCSQTKIYKDSTEQEEDVIFNLEFEDEDEAYSWMSSMVYGGAEKLE